MSDDAIASLQIRRVATRAIWRLNILEWVILAVAAGLALLAGALAAFLANAALGLPFRPSWVVASLLIFGVPAAVTYLRERRAADPRMVGGASGPPSASRIENKGEHGG